MTSVLSAWNLSMASENAVISVGHTKVLSWAREGRRDTASGAVSHGGRGMSERLALSAARDVQVQRVEEEQDVLACAGVAAQPVDKAATPRFSARPLPGATPRRAVPL